MDRKKPRLTSPWKVGFFVALLLVVTALGVSYFITGTFGITWHWIQVGGLSPKTWSFHLGAFLEEMAPLLLITSLLAFGAYVLVAGAVRRYKAYVDSGVEYKQLLKSIKSIDDLEDTDLVDKLKAHPELREFLMGVKHRVAAGERPNGERIAKHLPGPQHNNGVERATIASECKTLADAIDGGRDNFPREITLTIIELKQIEHALRRCFASMPTAPVTDASAGELEELRNTVRTTLEALRRDVAACGSGAREAEAAVAALQGNIETGSSPQPAGNVAEVQKRIDTVAEALKMLGEETRRIAIGSALQASGGPEGDTVKVAEELKTLATRFNTVARHWGETVPALKEILSGAGSARGPRGNAPAAVANVAQRTRLWGERAVAMNEHVRALERAIGMTTSVRPAAASEFNSAAVEVDAPPVSSAPRNADDDVVAGSNTRMFGGTSNEDLSFVDVPGFEKEHRLFADPPASGEEADDRFVVDNHQEKSWDLSEEPAEEKSAAAPQPKPATSDPDGFLTGPRPTVSAQRVERPAPAPVQPLPPRAPAPEPSLDMEAATATATLDPDADAVDLYAMGAIDCVQTV